MNIELFQKELRDKLTLIDQASGSIFYSSYETIKPSDVYLMGFNPGGDPNNINETVGQSIANFPFAHSVYSEQILLPRSDW